MRSRLLLLGCLLLTGCVDAVDDDDATPDDVADDDDTPAYRDGPGPPAAGQGVCEEVRSQSAWCIAHGALGLPSRAVGLDDGVVCEVDAYVVAAGRSSIGMAGDEAAAWNDGLLIGDLAAGEGWHTAAQSAEATGVTEFSGGWVTLRGFSEVSWYPDLDGVTAGVGGTTFPWEPSASRIAGGDTHLLAAWHAGSEVDVFDVLTEEARTVPLQGFDGWIHGLDYLPGDGRIALLTDDGVQLFDADSGAPEGTFALASDWGYSAGLSCHAPVLTEPPGAPPAWTFPAPASAPTIAQCGEVTDQSRWCVYRGEEVSVAVGLDDGARCSLAPGGPLTTGGVATMASRATPTTDGLATCALGVLSSWDPTGRTLLTSIPAPCLGLDYDGGGVLAHEQTLGPMVFARYTDLEALRAGSPDWTTTLDVAGAAGWVAGTDRVYVTPFEFGSLAEYALPSGEHIQTRQIPWAYGSQLAILSSGELVMMDLATDELVLLDPATLAVLQRWAVDDPSSDSVLNCYPTL